jgi:hypothetical protein
MSKMIEKEFVNKRIWLGGLVLLASLSNYSCKYDSREDIAPTVSCDTSKVTFVLTIKPILVNNCVECHSGLNPAGGLNYATYPDVTAVATSVRLLGALKHLPGFQPMPRFAPKLPDCEILKIEKWVNEGALNN